MGCPCTKGRKVFPSQRAAARALGISKITVAYHLNTHGNLDRAGLGQRRPWATQNAAKPLTVFGHNFPSRTAASRELGVSVSQLRRWQEKPRSPYFHDLILGAVMRWQAQQRRAA